MLRPRRGNLVTIVSVQSFCSLLLSLPLLAHIGVCGSFSHSISKSILRGRRAVTSESETRTTVSTMLRRSARLWGLSGSANASEAAVLEKSQKGILSASKKGKRFKNKTKSTTATKSNKTKTKRKHQVRKSFSDSTATASEIWCLPRTQEKIILSSADGNRFVMGIDEAGRGPLAGPVVAAAVIIPFDIEGITDSKNITREEDRELLYKEITESPMVRWAVAVMDAPFIDKVNILQATMKGMAASATALVADVSPPAIIELGEEKIPIVPTLTIERKGCYVITNRSSGVEYNEKYKQSPKVASVSSADKYCALIDGNRIPPDMPCESHSIIKGDSKEYAIAAASILAKVSRDRLMRDYHNLWPQFGLGQHKGYPTTTHMQAVKTYGASPIHRMTFRPLKDMTFDKDGKIIV